MPNGIHPHAPRSSRSRGARVILRAASVASLLTLFAAAAAQGQHFASTVPKLENCDSASWSTSTLLQTADGRNVYVESPTVVPYSSGLLLFGTPTFEWASHGSLADPFDPKRIPYDSVVGVWLDSHNRATVIKKPPTRYAMHSVRAITVGSTVHVVWGETPDTTGGPFTSVTALWHAQYDKHGWSTPERILEADYIWWNAGSPPLQLVNGEVAIAVPAQESRSSNAHNGVAFLHRTRTGWAASWVETYGPPYAALVQAFDEKRLFIAFLGSMFYPNHGPNALYVRPRTENNAVFASHSSDGGASWDTPEPIERLGKLRGNNLMLARDNQRRLHLGWIVDDLTPPLSTQAIHFSSDDAGWSWQRSAPVALPLRANSFTGGLLANEMYSIGKTEIDGDLMSIRWSHDGKATLTMLPVERSGTVPRISSVAGDSLWLAWGAFRPDTGSISPTHASPVALLSKGRRACRSE